MIFLQANTPEEYQEYFYKQIGLSCVRKSDSCIFWEHPQVGYIHSYGSLDRIKSGIGNYTIPLEFLMEYKHEHTYLHFGVIYKGITYSIVDNKTVVKSTPSDFLSIERSPSGIIHWKPGQRFRGVEISVDMDYLQSTLLPVLGIDKQALSFLQENIRYTSLSEELKAIIFKMEDLINRQKLTIALQTAMTLEFISLLLHPDHMKILGYHESSFSKYVQVGNRSIRITKEDLNKIMEARKLIKDNADTFPTPYALSRQLKISEQKLKAGFHSLYQQTIWDFANSVRMNKAIHLLRNTDTSIHNISQIVGYQSQTAFNNMFKKWSGITPKQFRFHTQSKELRT
jgi:AraC-like DNA-binding protein